MARRRISGEVCLTSRFYFDLTDGLDTLRDDEGVEANSLDDAIRQTQTVLDEIRDDGNASAFEDGWQLVIRDEHGNRLTSLPVTRRASVAPRDPGHGRVLSNDNEEITEAMQS